MGEKNPEPFSRKFSILMGSIEFRFFVFFLSVLLLSLPFFTPSEGRTLYFPFEYYFLSWIVIVVVIAIMNIFGDDEPEPEDEDEDILPVI